MSDDFKKIERARNLVRSVNKEGWSMEMVSHAERCLTDLEHISRYIGDDEFHQVGSERVRQDHPRK